MVMLFDVLPVLIIFTAAAVGLIVFTRRLPDIAAINVDTIPEEQAAHVKRRLLAARFERKMRAMFAGFWQRTAAARANTGQALTKFGRMIQALEQRYRAAAREAPVHSSDATPSSSVSKPAIVATPQHSGASLLAAAEAARREHNFEVAEQSYLELIKLDSHNADAYGGLGLLYRDKGMYEEAREALEYAVKLHEAADTYAALGDVAQARQDYDGAITAYDKATILEPLNSDYLDHYIEVCILGGRNSEAASAIAKWRTRGVPESHLKALSARLKPSPIRRRRGVKGTLPQS